MNCINLYEFNDQMAYWQMKWFVQDVFNDIVMQSWFSYGDLYLFGQTNCLLCTNDLLIVYGS